MSSRRTRPSPSFNRKRGGEEVVQKISQSSESEDSLDCDPIGVRPEYLSRAENTTDSRAENIRGNRCGDRHPSKRRNQHHESKYQQTDSTKPDVTYLRISEWGLLWKKLMKRPKRTIAVFGIILLCSCILIPIILNNTNEVVKKNPEICFNELKGFPGSNMFRGALYEATTHKKSALVSVIIDPDSDDLFEEYAKKFITFVEECYVVTSDFHEFYPKKESNSLLIQLMKPVTDHDLEIYFTLDNLQRPSIHIVPIYFTQEATNYVIDDSDLCIKLLRFHIQVHLDKANALASRLCGFVFTLEKKSDHDVNVTGRSNKENAILKGK